MIVQKIMLKMAIFHEVCKYELLKRIKLTKKQLYYKINLFFSTAKVKLQNIIIDKIKLSFVGFT